MKDIKVTLMAFGLLVAVCLIYAVVRIIQGKELAKRIGVRVFMGR